MCVKQKNAKVIGLCSVTGFTESVPPYIMAMAAVVALGLSSAFAAGPQIDHIVVLMEENRVRARQPPGPPHLD
jgi:phospholipase C